MAKIILNAEFNPETTDEKQTGKYLFDAENGTEPTECTIWLEKSKANDKHPDGKPWIMNKEMVEVCNRKYISEDLFIAQNVDGAYEVEFKTSAPRVIGATGVKKTVIKYLSEEEAVEYTELVQGAVEIYKTEKASSRKKKVEEMTAEELEAYIEALKTGTKITPKTGPTSFLDVMTEEEYNRYNELIAISQENKANAPKVKRGPLTEEEKAARKAKRAAKEISKAEELLRSLRAE